MLEDTPIYSFVSLLAHQLVGWQTYLLFNVTAGTKSRPIQGKRTGWFQTNSHFDPTGSLWTESQRHLIAISDLGLLLMGAAVWYLSQQVGLLKTFLIYFVPYLWVHHWLGMSLSPWTLT
jgi:omega-6 fatty acid desaturase (delta-12 desaturase)